MKGERYAAIRTAARFAAIAAQKRSREPAAIQKQNCLFAFFQPICNGGSQFFRENSNRLFFSAFLPKIDNTHERHLLFVHALGESGEAIFADHRVVIAFERWRSASKDNYTLLDLGAHHRDIARVITGRFLLLVSRFVFFIDHDEPEIFQRRENRAARADYNTRTAGMNFVPFIVAFALGQMTVQHRDRILRFGKTSLETFDRLRR